MLKRSTYDAINANVAIILTDGAINLTKDAINLTK